MKHKHKWTFMGIVTGDHRHGLAHRTCRCGAELYQPTTKQERAKHDPRNEIGSIEDSIKAKSESHARVCEKTEAMQKVVDAAVIWNDQVPALSQVEAKLVSAVVAYKNLMEKGKVQ